MGTPLRSGACRVDYRRGKPPGGPKYRAPRERGHNGLTHYQTSLLTVTPLRNLTGDADQHYFAEAFTDHLVTDLLRCCRGLSFALSPDKRDAVRNLAPAEAPDLEYVVAGSAQHSTPGMLRVNMRISDGATAEYLWAGRYEFHPEDLANIRTEITRQISRELHILLLEV
jgi:TolB-like protein